MTPQERLAKCEAWVRDNVKYFNPRCTCLDCQITRRMSGEAEEIRHDLGLVGRAPLPHSEDAVRSSAVLQELQIQELESSRDITEMALGWALRHTYDLNTPNPYENPSGEYSNHSRY